MQDCNCECDSNSLVNKIFAMNILCTFGFYLGYVAIKLCSNYLYTKQYDDNVNDISISHISMQPIADVIQVDAVAVTENNGHV